ncbi:MAG TPA: GFA family protein [Caulobacteraceae bacterium]|jgi:hypothetical protein
MSTFSGGCQCGAVRFRVDAPLVDSAICHCRMCQKATGGLFGAFASFPTPAVAWTRGARKVFRSSEHIDRGFCGDCGTPLTFEAAGEGRHIGLTIGSLDAPAAVRPEKQIMVDERLAWIDALADIPRRSPEDEAARAAKYPPVVSRQHPDHDTETWPLADGAQ